jgi:hypothetical protein
MGCSVSMKVTTTRTGSSTEAGATGFITDPHHGHRGAYTTCIVHVLRTAFTELEITISPLGGTAHSPDAHVSPTDRREAGRQWA